MNVLILTVILSAVLVNSSTLTLKDYLKYLERDEPRTNYHAQRKPVIGSAMVKQYFNDELVDPAFQPQRPDHYDLANDPDPIIENLPPNHNNLGFLANLNEGQLHDLIKEGLKYQEIANEMIKENEGVVELGSDESEESSESSDIDTLDMDEMEDLHLIVDEEYEGEHDIENMGEIQDESDEDDEEVMVTTTPKPTTTEKTKTISTERSTTTTTEEPTTTTSKPSTTTEKTTTTTERQTTITETTTKKPTTTSSSTTTTTPEPTSTTEKPTTTTEKTTTTERTTTTRKPKRTTSTTPKPTTTTPKPTTTPPTPTTTTPTTTPQPTTQEPTTTNSLINRIVPISALDEIASLTPDEIDEDIVPIDPDNVYGPEQIATDTETDIEEQTLVEPATTKRPLSAKPTKRPSAVRPIQSKPKPSKRPNRRPGQPNRPGKRPVNQPGRRPNRRPNKRPNKRPGIPQRIHVTKKGSNKRKGGKGTYKIKINPPKRKLAISQIQRLPMQVKEVMTMCPYECQCGVTTSRRIVGGTNAQKNEFPWVALLSYNGQLTCGGAIINSEYVITAAHCMHLQKKKLFTVKLMQHNRKKDDRTQLIIRTISKVYIHPNYNSKTTDKDIALIKLNAPVDFSKTPVRPICLPSLGKDFVGCTGIIAGWGTTSENGSESTILKKAKVPIISNQQCKAAGLKGITSNMLCAGRVVKGGVDSCQGDSGGPLMVADNKRYVLGGIVSFGEGCARPKSPGVYTRTTKFLDWIKKTASSGCYCK